LRWGTHWTTLPSLRDSFGWRGRDRFPNGCACSGGLLEYPWSLCFLVDRAPRHRITMSSDGVEYALVLLDVLCGICRHSAHSIPATAQQGAQGVERLPWQDWFKGIAPWIPSGSPSSGAPSASSGVGRSAQPPRRKPRHSARLNAIAGCTRESSRR